MEIITNNNLVRNALIGAVTAGAIYLVGRLVNWCISGGQPRAKNSLEGVSINDLISLEGRKKYVLQSIAIEQNIAGCEGLTKKELINHIRETMEERGRLARLKQHNGAGNGDKYPKLHKQEREVIDFGWPDGEGNKESNYPDLNGQRLTFSNINFSGGLSDSNLAHGRNAFNEIEMPKPSAPEYSEKEEEVEESEEERKKTQYKNAVWTAAFRVQQMLPEDLKSLVKPTISKSDLVGVYNTYLAPTTQISFEEFVSQIMSEQQK